MAKRSENRPSPDFDAIEKEMVLSGVEIDKARQDVLTNIMEMQKRSVSSFPAANLQLKGTRFSSAQAFLLALRDNRRQDIIAGRTLIGPHLTDLCAVYSSKNINSKDCSTGEQKALLISIIIATAKIQIEVFQTPPILLFDEISAHLDEERRSMLYDELDNLNVQVFLTGTDFSTFEQLKNRAKFYEVILNSDASTCAPRPSM